MTPEKCCGTCRHASEFVAGEFSSTKWADCNYPFPLLPAWVLAVDGYSKVHESEGKGCKCYAPIELVPEKVE